MCILLAYTQACTYATVHVGILCSQSQHVNLSVLNDLLCEVRVCVYVCVVVSKAINNYWHDVV